MAYSAIALITEAYYLSNKVSRDFESVGGNDLQSGLRWLNELLSLKAVDIDLIPYYSQYTFNSVVGQERYLIPNLAALDSITFNLGDIRIPLQYQTRDQYFNTARVNHLNTILINWTMERAIGGSYIYFYPFSDQVYACNIVGKFFPELVTGNEDLSELMDPFYIRYLTYSLAKEICIRNGIVVDAITSKELESMEDKISSLSPKDLTVKMLSPLAGHKTGFGWFDVFIGKGWRPN